MSYQFIQGEMQVTHANGTVTRIPLRLRDNLIPRRRKLMPRSVALKTIVGSGFTPIYQFDTNTRDKIRWCWNNGIQFAFRYY